MKHRLTEVGLSQAKQAAQVRELTRLVISLRDEVWGNRSGFFGKRQPEPVSPVLDFNDLEEKPNPGGK